jgi:hypothetical protein
MFLKPCKLKKIAYWTVLIVVVLVFLGWTAAFLLAGKVGFNTTKVVLTGRTVHDTKFLEYIPSILEDKWYQQREIFEAEPSRICQALEDEADALILWVASLSSKSDQKALFQHNNTTKDLVFSKLVYFSQDSDKKHVRVIEPLVGHLRHPFALPHCKPGALDAVDVQDRSYIAFAGKNSWDSSLFPGKKYLFDLGTSDFQTSLAYIIAQYGNLGIQFDRIWAWEAETKPEYWKTVSESIQGNLHFYNTPVSSNVKSMAHPLQILKNVYEIGDFVVRLDNLRQ